MRFSLGRLASAFLCLFVLVSIPAMSAASTILRYEFDVLVTSTSYTHGCERSGTCDGWAPEERSYQGPAVSTFGAGWITVDLSRATEATSGDGLAYHGAAFDYSIFGLPVFHFLDTAVSAFDPLTGHIRLWGATYDDIFQATLSPGGIAGGSFGALEYEQDGTGVDNAIVGFRFYNVTFDGGDAAPSPQISSMPLPAGFALLLAGIAALGGLQRLR